jgi:hypothetical protein
VIFGRLLDRIIALAARHAVPAIWNDRSYPAAGGLMSYGADNRDAYRQVPCQPRGAMSAIRGRPADICSLRDFRIRPNADLDYGHRDRAGPPPIGGWSVL